MVVMAVGRIGAVRAGNKAGRNQRAVLSDKRVAAAKQEREVEEVLLKLFKAYDKNKSGSLDRGEVKCLLTDLDHSTPKGTEPSEEELDYVMGKADDDKTGQINASELALVCSVWSTFTKLRSECEELMKKHTDDIEKGMNFEQVKAYLTDLNGGHEVSEEEALIVFKDADVDNSGTVGKTEIIRATSYWYAHAGAKEKEKKSYVCSMM